MSADFLTDDLDTVLSEKDFGHTGGVRWKDVLIKDVIFDDESIEAVMGEGVAEIIPQPMITGKTSDFIGIKVEDEFTINDEKFIVKNWKPDGTGIIEIFLERL